MALKGQNKKYTGLPDFKKCQFFTPEEIASKMIGYAKIKDMSIDQRVLECSCGDGSILCQAVDCYIQSFINDLTLNELSCRLAEQFYGFEIDPEKIDVCRRRLDGITSRYLLPKVKWKLFCCDFLDADIDVKFDVIVGNPPYVSYINLSETTREIVKLKFESCKDGKFDYCFPFIEKCISFLSDRGRLIFITPESIFKTKSASTIRQLMLPLLEMIDGSLESDIFELAQITPSIFCLQNGVLNSVIKYKNRMGSDTIIDKKDMILSGKWAFLCNESSRTNGLSKLLRFGDCYRVSSSIATLYNSVFLLQGGQLVEDYYVCQSGEKIERGLIRPAISPSSRRRSLDYFIIYPYKNGRPYTEEELFSKFPGGYSYLLARKDKLMDRDIDSNAKWFEYGRKQSIWLTPLDKYCLSIFVTGKPSLWRSAPESVAFSGILISEIDKVYPLSSVPTILSDEKFLRYVEAVGIPCSSGSWRITATDLKEYRFNGNN